MQLVFTGEKADVARNTTLDYLSQHGLLQAHKYWTTNTNGWIQVWEVDQETGEYREFNNNATIVELPDLVIFQENRQGLVEGLSSVFADDMIPVYIKVGHIEAAVGGDVK